MAEELLKNAYEVARELRVQRNKKIMQELGLHSEQENDHEDEAILSKKKKVRVKAEPSRRSKRVQGLTPEGGKIELPVDRHIDDEEEDEDDFTIRMNAKIERLKNLHKERKTGYKNPTATYEHTWMRVRTMSDKALARRIKVIETALGQHCVVKMRMFAEVLVLAEKSVLADQAQEALERLLALGLK
jgi:hypothetical protein